MSLRSFIRKIAGRAGNASRSKRGANSHVNTQANKRAASKAVRQSYRADLVNFKVEGTRTGRYYHTDYHLDVPDEIKERYKDE
jgi:hypothetical protein